MIKSAKQVLRRPFTTNITGRLIRAIAVGLVTGLIVSIFRWIIDQTMQILYHIYPQMAAHQVLILPYILLMIAIAFILGKITAPYLDQVIGSGVPQIEAIFLNENKLPRWSILWRKFIGGLLAICPGLMLGREGPCIEMGAMVGQGLGQNAFKTDATQLK